MQPSANATTRRYRTFVRRLVALGVAAALLQVILCSGACTAVKADPGAEVDVVLGCPTNGLK